MDRKFQYGNIDVHYQVFGAGTPLVLLHGFAEDSSVWREQIAPLQQHFQLLLPDLPGSGKSGMLEKKEAGIEDFADCINALLVSEKTDRCILLGHSMGGYITLAFAEKYPKKLLAFGFIHSTAFADNEEKKATRKKAIKLMEEYGVYPFLKTTTPNLFSDKYKKQHLEKITELTEQGKRFSTEALVQYYTAMINRPDRTAVLEKSKVPVLFIIGSEDKAAPLQDLQHQVHLPKFSVVHLIEGVGHMSMWEEPARLNEHILRFAEEIVAI